MRLACSQVSDLKRHQIGKIVARDARFGDALPRHGLESAGRTLTRKRVGVLISGRGSNLQALIDACKAPDYPAEIVLVISNVPGAQGLLRAEAAGIPALAINHKDFRLTRGFRCGALTAR